MSTARPRRVLPPSMIGMLGGGQLGRYALVAARTMGYRTMVLEPDPGAPAGAIADVHLVAAYDDPDALRRMADECAVVTTEFENPPASALTTLERRTLVAPSSRAVSIAQDRRREKAFLVGAGFPVGRYSVIDEHSVDASADGNDLPSSFRYPAILKTARLGYDGKGQRLVGDASSMRAAWKLFGGVPCVLEQALQLQSEVSVVVARDPHGGFASYPVTQNRHVNGILDVSFAPARISPRLADRAVGLAMAIADALDYVGVLAVEFFVVDGELFVNELAPRPHNSGHWTLDAAACSQFEQQIRAICGVGLGDTSMTRRAAAMANLLGDLWEGVAAGGDPDWSLVLEHPQVALHLYGKATPRPGRKMGHLTTWGESVQEVEVRALDVRNALR